MKKSILGAAIVAGTVLSVPAANADFIANIGYAIGGDTLAETSGTDLDAGAGLYGDIDMLYQPDESSISFSGNCWFKV